MSDWKKRLGVLYSTDPNYSYTTEDDQPEVATLPPAGQRLRLSLSRKQRGGKEVTLITGFVGSDEDLEALGRPSASVVESEALPRTERSSSKATSVPSS